MRLQIFLDGVAFVIHHTSAILIFTTIASHLTAINDAIGAIPLLLQHLAAELKYPARAHTHTRTHSLNIHACIFTYAHIHTYAHAYIHVHHS